ncbi:hypothetical protein B0W01_24950 [Serratia marcescens]|nr:hypothetical protein B0W01_24950 [Serratia marcescens]
MAGVVQPGGRGRWGAGLSLISPSYFKLHLCWLRLRAPLAYLSKLPGNYKLAALMQLELFRGYPSIFTLGQQIYPMDFQLRPGGKRDKPQELR